MMTDPDYIEWTRKIVQCKQAIMKTSNKLTSKYLDSRLDELLAAPALAEIVRRGVQVSLGADENSIDVAMHESTPPEIKSMINSYGSKLASVYLSETPVTHKDQMVELGAMVMLCCQLLMTKICTSLTTENDRLVLAAASTELMQDTIASMLKIMQESAKPAAEVSVS